MLGPARIILLVGGLSATWYSHAQEGPAPASTPEKGLSFQKDSTASLNLGVRVQNRIAYAREDGMEALDLRVRRLRLKLDGYVLDPRLEYTVQLGFSRQDMDLGDGISGPSPVVDAIAMYRLAPRTRIGFGQMRMAGGRQILTSDANWEAPDRPAAASAYSLDRDIGLHLLHDLAFGEQVLHFRAAITQGEGKSLGGRNTGLCYTARADWLPLGPFKGGGEYVEGDLLREEKPKVAVAAAFSMNTKARRARAQLGPFLPQDRHRTIHTLFADMHFKYRGWGWQNEFSRRFTRGTPLVTDTAGHVLAAVNDGWGFTSQLGRMLGKRSQLVAMYSTLHYEEELGERYTSSDEVLLGYNYYIQGHRIKLQAAVSHAWRQRGQPGGPTGPWGAVVQLQWGIG